MVSVFLTANRLDSNELLCTCFLDLVFRWAHTYACKLHLGKDSSAMMHEPLNARLTALAISRVTFTISHLSA